AVAPSSLVGKGVAPPGGGPLNPKLIHVWVTTSRARTARRSPRSGDIGSTGGFVQIDRTGAPAISDLLIGLPKTLSGPLPNPATKLERKNLLNRTDPSQDVRLFGAEVREELVERYGNSADAANGKVSLLLPDVLVLDTSSTAGFPNGRRPGDDAIDTMLRTITGSPSATDGVNLNDKPLEATFPFFGLQHTPDEDPGPRA